MTMADDDITVDVDDAASRALAKLRTFIGTLPEDERTVLAALIAPGVASAYQEDAELERDVVGFGMTEPWRPERLPDALSTRIRSQHVRIEFEQD